MHYCRFCNKECKNKNSLVNHERLCKQNPDYDSNKFECEFCGRTFSRINSYKAHLNRCKSNPDVNNITTNYNPWNKGLTKYDNEKLMEKSINQSNRIKSGEVIGAFGRRGNNNFSCSSEIRAKISASMKGNHNNNPQVTGRGKKGWYKGIFCSSTYELAFLIYCFDHNIDVKRYDGFYIYSYGGKTRRYYPDFIINNTLVEIKGYYTPQVEAKTLSVTDRPIKVLYRKDLDEVFNYIFDTYGKIVDKNIHELYENMGD